jgi:Phosphotransferase enzyme family
MELDRKTLTPPVRRLLGDSTAEIEAISAQPLGGGFAESSGGGLGTFRIEGTAIGARGRRGFRMVAKGLADDLTGSADPREWNFWKREAMAYASGALATLPPGIAAPVCYGVDDKGDRATIFLEAVPEQEAAWTIETYRCAAEALGRFNGAYLAGRSRPDFPWMMPGRVRNWLGLSADVISRLREEADEPILSAWLSEGTLDRTLELWRRRDELVGALQSLPVCLCHHDGFRRNLIVRADRGGGREVVGIDWSMVGPGAVGEDLAPLVGVSLQFMDVEMDAARDFERAVLAGYLGGLRIAGWTGPAEAARLGFTASTSLLLGLGAFGVWLPYLRDPAYGPVVERVIGKPMGAFLGGLAKLQSYAMDLGDEALSLASLAACRT